MIKFFIASSWEDREIAREYARKIKERFKWECTTDWWFHEDRNKKLQYAMEDLENLKRSDVLFVYNGDKKTSGKLIEIGIALGLGIKVFLYGNKLSTVYDEIIVYKGENL